MIKDRRAARRLALDVLYEAEIRDELPMDALRARQSEGWVDATPEDADADDGAGARTHDALAYAEVLIDGVQEHHADIDRTITTYADRWAIERMPVVDRTLLRIALFELLWRDDIPVPVAINEAVELAKSLSTEDSGRFVNGLLGRVAESETRGTER